MNEILEELSEFRKIRSGGEATVYRAVLGEKEVVFKWKNEAGTPNGELSEIFKSSPVPNTAKLYGEGVLDGRPYTVMEYIRGISSAKASPIPPRVAVKAMRKLAAALESLSAKGVFHGDLSTENILLDSKAEPVLIDFGICGLGTPRFAAPERFEGTGATEKSELFSLGAVLYEWLSGEPLFGGNSVAAIESAVFAVESSDITLLLHGRGKLPPEAVGAFTPIWKGTLRRNPEDRFEDFEEFDECLEIAENRLGELLQPGEREAEALWRSGLEMSIREGEERLDAADEEFPFGRRGGTESGANRTETKLPGKKILFGGGLLLFLAILVVFIFLWGTSSPDVEIVGKSMLESSRSETLSEEPEDLGAKVDEPLRGVVFDADSAEEK